MRLTSRFKVLLAEKEMREKRTISLREVVRATGVPISTVQGLANDTLREIPSKGLVEICQYLQCSVGDLLQLADIQTLDLVGEPA